MRARWLCATLCLLALGAGGCTRVTVQGGDGAVRSQSGFGVIRLDTRPGAVPQIVDVEGFGVVSQNGGLTIGYVRSNYAILPTDDCRVVVWIDRDTPPPAFLDGLAAKGDTVCLAGPGVSKKGGKE